MTKADIQLVRALADVTEITVGGQRPFWYIGADGSD